MVNDVFDKSEDSPSAKAVQVLRAPLHAKFGGRCSSAGQPG
jgi:hypothetical protein